MPSGKSYRLKQLRVAGSGEVFKTVDAAVFGVLIRSRGLSPKAAVAG
jgi:hypothetical protein